MKKLLGFILGFAAVGFGLKKMDEIKNKKSVHDIEDDLYLIKIRYIKDKMMIFTKPARLLAGHIYFVNLKTNKVEDEVTTSEPFNADVFKEYDYLDVDGPFYNDAIIE